MRLTDSEIEEIATRPCSATGQRKKDLAIEVRELRARVASLDRAARSALVGLEVAGRAIAAHIEHAREPIGRPLELAALQVEAVIARLLGAVGKEARG